MKRKMITNTVVFDMSRIAENEALLVKMNVSGAVFCMDGDERDLIITFLNILCFRGQTLLHFPPPKKCWIAYVMWQDAHSHTQHTSKLIFMCL